MTFNVELAEHAEHFRISFRGLSGLRVDRRVVHS